MFELLAPFSLSWVRGSVPLPPPHLGLHLGDVLSLPGRHSIAELIVIAVHVVLGRADATRGHRSEEGNVCGGHGIQSASQPAHVYK